MNENNLPYQRKTLYLLLTIPMIALYITIAVILWHINIAYLVLYCTLFIIVAISQSYVCVYLRCPYVGKFAPCVGGFCLPSSQIAKLFKNAQRRERTYNIIVSLAFASFLGIIVFPTYFLYLQSVYYLLIYLGIVLVYAVNFLWLICPVCGTRHVCPGGQTSTKLKEIIVRK
jgi:hypothetical protein